MISSSSTALSRIPPDVELTPDERLTSETYDKITLLVVRMSNHHLIRYTFVLNII